MRAANRPGWAMILTAAALWPATSFGQGPASSTTVGQPSATIGSHQIDRFEAIRQVQSDLRSDANNVANWVILGELAHEVAIDLPEPQDNAYYQISRDAYEKALQLDPNNNGLKAAVQFARDQEANAANFDAQRRRGVTTYLEARRREIAANGANPTVMVYETPNTNLPTLPPPQNPDRVLPGNPAGYQAQPGVVQQPLPTYRPLYNQQQGQAYNYNQYSNSYVPPTTPAQAAPPTTLRQFGQQLPGMLLNDAARQLQRPR